MISLRPVLGALRNRGGAARLGDFFLHEAEPGMYRISNTDQDVGLERASSLEPYRLNGDLPGTGGIVSDDGFFRILG